MTDEELRLESRISVLEFEKECLQKNLDFAIASLKRASLFMIILGGLQGFSLGLQLIAWLMKKGIM